MISAGKLGSQGCEIKFDLDRWKVKKGALVIAQGGKMGSLYVVESRSKVGVIHPMRTCSLSLSQPPAEESDKNMTKEENERLKIIVAEFEFTNSTAFKCAGSDFSRQDGGRGSL